MKFVKLSVVCATMLMLAACGSRSSSSVSPTTGAAGEPAAQSAATDAVKAKDASQVILTENDITDRPYRSLGDIEVTVSKWTIFDADPTKEKVAEALKAKAAEMGADAVVLARYGTVGVSFTSWGAMDGNGRAVVFQH